MPQADLRSRTFRDMFGDESIVLRPDMTAADVPGPFTAGRELPLRFELDDYVLLAVEIKRRVDKHPQDECDPEPDHDEERDRDRIDQEQLADARPTSTSFIVIGGRFSLFRPSWEQ